MLARGAQRPGAAARSAFRGHGPSLRGNPGCDLPGAGTNYPIALEGALKLKEISYIHAEGYPAGEMKHGPIALLDTHVPVISIAVPGVVFEKVLSNARKRKRAMPS